MPMKARITNMNGRHPVDGMCIRAYLMFVVGGSKPPEGFKEQIPTSVSSEPL